MMYCLGWHGGRMRDGRCHKCYHENPASVTLLQRCQRNPKSAILVVFGGTGFSR